MPFDSLSFPSPASPAISITGDGPTSQCFLTAYRFLLQPRQLFRSLAMATHPSAFDFCFFITRINRAPSLEDWVFLWRFGFFAGLLSLSLRDVLSLSR